MRTLIIGLSLLFSVTSALAAPKHPCSSIETPASQQVGEDTQGYRAVEVNIDIPTASGKDPQKGFYSLGMYMPAAQARHDKDKSVQRIAACSRDFSAPNGRFFPAGTVWFRVMATVKSQGESSYTLTTRIYLPQTVVEKKPVAYTVLNSGAGYRGQWNTDDEIAVLTLVHEN